MLHEMNGDVSLRLQEISTLLIQEGNLDALYERRSRLPDAGRRGEHAEVRSRAG
jgi:hypothetical protein